MSAQQLKALAVAGRLHPRDLVRHGREAAWVPAGRLKGLFSGSASRVGSNPGVDGLPPVAGGTAIHLPPSTPGGAPPAGGTPLPLSSEQSGRFPPARPQGAAAAPGTLGAAAERESSTGASPSVSGRASPPQGTHQAVAGLEFLEEEYSAPAGFKAPRPKSAVSDVLEQKRQRERRNLTILAGVALGLMLILGVLMTILFFKQRQGVPESDGHSTAVAPPPESADKSAGAERRSTEAAGQRAAPSLNEVASRGDRSPVAVSPSREPQIGPGMAAGSGATPQRIGPNVRHTERAAAPPPGRPSAKARDSASAKPPRKAPHPPKPDRAGDEPPPPTGDPEKDLGIGADMPPPGEPTPWSALPDPPPKESPKEMPHHR